MLLVALVVAGLAAGLATRLQLRTAISELLPTDDPAVQALERTKQRVSDLSLLVVGHPLARSVRRTCATPPP